jgi:hypothetical protein
MMIDQQVLRREHVERMNGRAATWWHYNRMTLAVLLSAVATLAILLSWSRQTNDQLRQDNRLLGNAPSMACYSEERATSLIIAGGSQRAVDDALRYAAEQTYDVRGAWHAAQGRAFWPDGVPARKGCRGQGCK